MKNSIIKTKDLNIETIKALLQVLKERSVAENKVILCWKQKAKTTNTSLTDEGMSDLKDKYTAVLKEYSRLKKTTVEGTPIV